MPAGVGASVRAVVVSVGAGSARTAEGTAKWHGLCGKTLAPSSPHSGDLCWTQSHMVDVHKNTYFFPDGPTVLNQQFPSSG